ncbi:aminotransferase class V-fold PLP-dependent enzyme [Pendulispora rubella]|uniref:Aminotransferase class V-fold PLP-dependent enzyme n=1 Tax=Pendulispora rubella TaxID=2741070 RepID=A0ABZ2L5F7_9BACT
MMDFERARERFPILLDRTYLAASTLGPCPREMLADFYAYGRTLRHRARCLPEWVDRWNELRTYTETLLGAPAGSVFLCDTATTAQATLAASIEPVGSRCRIVISSADFHSARYLWHARSRAGFEIVEIPTGVDGYIDIETWLGVLDERVRIVSFSLVSPRTGALLDAAAICRAARRVNAVVVIDVYQALGIVPVRVHELGAHAIVGGFHKWMGGGGMGLAFGYIEPSLCDELVPMYPGWLGHRQPFDVQHAFEPARDAQKFQRGAPAMEPIYTSRAGIRWVVDTGIDAIRARSLLLTDRLIERARERDLVVTTPLARSRRGGMVCLDIRNASTLATKLGVRGIDVDARPNAGLRIAPHPCIREDECDAVIDALCAEIRGVRV